MEYWNAVCGVLDNVCGFLDDLYAVLDDILNVLSEIHHALEGIYGFLEEIFVISELWVCWQNAGLDIIGKTNIMISHDIWWKVSSHSIRE